MGGLHSPARAPASPVRRPPPPNHRGGGGDGHTGVEYCGEAVRWEEAEEADGDVVERCYEATANHQFMVSFGRDFLSPRVIGFLRPFAGCSIYISQKEGSSFGGSKVIGFNYSVSEIGGHFPRQSTASGAALDLDENLIDSHPAAIHYFFHHNPLVRDLVHQRLQHFVPIGADRSKREQIGAENLNNRRRFDQCASANDRWVTPNRGASVATEVGTRRNKDLLVTLVARLPLARNPA